MSINKKEEEVTLPREIDYSWIPTWCQQVDMDIREMLTGQFRSVKGFSELFPPGRE
ncbi:hypothetical protein ACR8TE_004266 [Salmonella enterica]